MGGRRGSNKVSVMMILSIIVVFGVLTAVTCAFEMLQRRQEKVISSAKNAEQNETTQEIYYETDENLISSDLNVEEVKLADVLDAEVEAGEIVYLIKGDNKGSNKYARVDKLSYTDDCKYTEGQLAYLDTYGLRITRNEIYARHGRMFNDQEIQEYFTNQSWYVPQVASGDFDESCLNEVEKYNAELIRSFELKQGN